MVDVLVLAAGKGARMQSSVNKMFRNINGIPVLYRTLWRWNAIPFVSRIILILRERDRILFDEMIAGFGKIKKIGAVVAGGETRSDSVRNGLRYISQNPSSDIVMTHDGARPFFSEDLVQRTKSKVSYRCIAVPSLRIYETVRQKLKHHSSRIIDRETCFIIQTPQAFHINEVEPCFLSFEQAALDLSDEAAYFEQKEYRVEMVEGEKWNIKITVQEDIAWGELLLQQNPILRLNTLE